MAEAIARRVVYKSVVAYSAGRKPAATVDAHALETLRQAGYDIDGLEPKSWNSFVNFSAPSLHVVVTMDEGLKKGPFPIWYSAPVHVHWPFADPEAASGGDREKQEVYRRLYGALEQQMLKLAGMNVEGLDANALKARLQSIAPTLRS